MNHFEELLRELQNGETLSECGDALKELIESVRLTGKVGTLTLVLKAKPSKSSDENVRVVSIIDEVKLKKPAFDRGETIFYADQSNTLMRSDPRQKEMFGQLKKLPGKATAEVEETATA